MSKKLVNGGLMIWEDHLRQFVLPRVYVRQAGLGEWATEVIGTRPVEGGGVANPVLGHLLAQERTGWSAGASMNAIVMGMPWDRRVVLFGELMGYGDEQVGRALGVAGDAVRALRREAHKELVAAMKRHAAVVMALGRVYGVNVRKIAGRD